MALWVEGGPRVLVADGAREMREAMAFTLSQMGARTCLADSGEELVEILASTRVEAIVIDAELPEIGGLQAVRVIGTFRRVPPYVLTARHVTKALRAAAMESQAVSVLRKPEDLALLGELVVAMMRGRGQEN